MPPSLDLVVVLRQGAPHNPDAETILGDRARRALPLSNLASSLLRKHKQLAGNPTVQTLPTPYRSSSAPRIEKNENATPGPSMQTVRAGARFHDTSQSSRRSRRPYTHSLAPRTRSPVAPSSRRPVQPSYYPATQIASPSSWANKSTTPSQMASGFGE
ncbi:hypothetical protein CALVIDRAFT_569441 [Calocera viscosa TUFC12733]|uniref:Uncharacterized protein n=1 Tax=Calocera viscosa (strain TUFC12733) TaxID=1330018 RepID=A0A167FZR0_CALVF|nr:hypothetical protein CALVIDRAFT_569441 [Calocera viscosa TUFC12733]